MSERDLSHLSDEDLQAVAAGKAVVNPQYKAQKRDLSHLSDSELMSVAAGQAVINPDYKIPSHGVLGAVSDFGKKIDSYTGAPTRAAIGAYQHNQSPVDAFAKQFGNDPENAPTGKQIAETAGVSKEKIPFEALPGVIGKAAGLMGFRPSYSDAAGLAVDVGADYTNLIPVGAIAKGAGKVAKVGIEGAGALAKGAAIGSVKALEGVPVAGKTAKVIEEGAKSTAATLGKIFSPKIAEDFGDMVKIAEKNGIDPSILPEAVEFGDNSFISRASRQKAEGVTGQLKLEKFKDGLAQVQQAYDSKVAKLAGGAPLAPVDVGNVIRQGYDDGIERFFQNIDLTHDKIVKTQPGLMVNRAERETLDSTMAGVEKFAKGRMQRGITKTQQEQGAQLLRAVSQYRNANGSYKQAVEAMRDLGEVAFKTSGSAADIPADVEKMRDMYFKMNDALLNTVRKDVNPEWAIELTNNNRAISDFVKKNAVVKDIIENSKVAPENVFNSIVLRGDSQKIEALKGVLTPEQLGAVKGSVLENLIKRDPDGAFNFKTLFSAMRNKQGLLKSLFEPSELQEFGEIVKLGDRFGDPILSSSKTGASNSFRDIGRSVGGAVANDALIEIMKDSARKGTGISVPGAAAKAVEMPARNGLRLPRRGKIERGAKGAQVYSIERGAERSIADDDK